MPVWLEVLLIWATIGLVLNILSLIVFRKRGYIQWLMTLYDDEAYKKGYADAKKHEVTDRTVYDTLPALLYIEHGIEDTRYK